MRALKACGRFGCPTLVIGATYCPEHSVRPPSPSSIAARSAAERSRRAAVVRAWVSVRGWVCPGYERPPHPSRDLTAAHSIAVSRGGSEISGVLCRSCNARMNDKPG